MMRHLRITVDGKPYDVIVEDVGEDGAAQAPRVAAPRPAASVAAPAAAPASAPAAAAPSAPRAAGSDDQLSPLAGVVLEISVSVGDAVTVDQQVAVLEAMKMKTVIGAHKAGRVVAIHVKPGDAVDADQPLMTIA